MIDVNKTTASDPQLKMNNIANEEARNALQNNIVNSKEKVESIAGSVSQSLLDKCTPYIVIISILICVTLFVVFFMLHTRRYGNYIRQITEGVNEIIDGNLDSKVPVKYNDEFTLLARQINCLSDSIKMMIEEEKKNEMSKNQLIESVAHDLRTPLTSIIGYLDLVRSDKIDELKVNKKYVNVAYDKTLRLQKQIEDLFTYTQFSFGHVTTHYSQIDMVRFLEQIGEEFYPIFQDSGITYEFSTDSDSACVYADGDLLARVFTNLISNAVKYGIDGKFIKVVLEEKESKVLTKVINYGELIPQKDIEHIFERFYRVETSRSSETGGTGLGLAIAKNIVEVHGGKITARSDISGTVFEVELQKHVVH
jgi:signal transduction histidine kinase